jgi:hypothetical protein
MKTKVKAQDLSISSKVYRYEVGEEAIAEMPILALENTKDEIIIKLESGVNKFLWRSL